MAYIDPELTGAGSLMPPPVDSSLSGSPQFQEDQTGDPAPAENFSEGDPGVCPTGNCPGETYAIYEPKDDFGAIDESIILPDGQRLWDPNDGLTLDQIVDQNSTPFSQFWSRFLDKYKELYGEEELIKLAASFSPADGRNGYNEVEWTQVGDYYSLFDPFEMEIYDNSRAGQFFGIPLVGAAFATSGSNWFRDRNVLQFYQDSEFDELSDADIATAARTLHQCIKIDENMTQWLSVAGDVAMVALTIAALFTGVGALVGAASVAIRAAALISLAMETSDAIQLGTKYIGVNDGKGINVLENCFTTLGTTIDADDGEKAGKVAYATMNMIFGLKGKWKFLAAVPVGLGYGAELIHSNTGTGEEVPFWGED